MFLKRFAVNRVTLLRLIVQKTLIHCSKTFTHNNIIKVKKFYITFAFWKCEGNKVLLSKVSEYISA